MTAFLWVLFLMTVVFIGFFNLGLLWGSFAIAICLLLLTICHHFCPLIVWLDAIFIVLALLVNIYPLRRLILSRFIFKAANNSIPTLSETEKQALNAGTVSFEGDLFSGEPSFKKLLSFKKAELTEEEQEFLDGPTEELCRMLDDWQIFEDQDLPKKAWQFIKDQGFLSMIIPKEYGGKEFSACAHSAVILKLGSRNLPAAISVGVPNSLGPAELLLRYGTKKQKLYFLPRLAKGEELPCFALTGPSAGSDAASIPDFGVICYAEFDGKNTLGIRLNWNKRYITLAPVATLIGLAFKLRDPDHLLSQKEELGITCALIPRGLKGIEIGQRHNPLNIMFQNGPITGTNVFIPLDYIIGGQAMIGQGWRMLMECLSAGRAITLPSSGSSSAMVAAMASGCYSRIRHQFGLPIGRFLGVQESLARIGTNAYLNLAALNFVLARITEGAQPPVASAIVKYHTTERCRQAINDAMDIHGGKGLCLGPKNYLTSLYRCAPINITVEGANILTRNMIIFGQGSIRCHPYLLKEMSALTNNDLKSFDQVFFEHTQFLYKNVMRAFVHGATCAHLVPAPASRAKKRFKQLSRYCAAFALVADVVTITLGAKLKRQENISAKLGDVLSYLYLASACLKRFHEDGQPDGDMPIINYLCDSLFHDIEQTMGEVYDNLPNRMVACFLRAISFPWGFRQKKQSDRLVHEVAQLMLYPNESFERMTTGIFKTKIKDNFLANLAEAQKKVVDAEDLEKRVRQAQKQNIVTGLSEEDVVNDANNKGIINQKEHEQLLEVVRLRAAIIAVDAF